LETGGTGALGEPLAGRLREIARGEEEASAPKGAVWFAPPVTGRGGRAESGELAGPACNRINLKAVADETAFAA